MRKLILMETGSIETTWPTEEIDEVKTNLYNYLRDYIPTKYQYTKHAIMGPAGKLLAIIAASQFGDNVDSYVGYIANIHAQQSEKYLTSSGMENLRSAVRQLIELKQKSSERVFLKILRSVDYGVYYMKVKEIGERSEAKKEKGEEK